MDGFKMQTLMCIGVVLIATALGRQEDCPSIEQIGCMNDQLPCQSPKPAMLQSTFTLKDGTVCQGCKFCSVSADVCPVVACAMIQLPPGCTKREWYHLTIPLGGQTCWACDYVRCMGD